MNPQHGNARPALAASCGQRPPRSLPEAIAVAALFLCSSLGQAADVALEWDPVDDDRVAYYEVHWGTAASQYERMQAVASTSLTVTSLSPGETYYFAARACADGGDPCSDYSNELSASIPHAAPEADFAISSTSGIAPHTVAFTNHSSGAIDSYSWDFGDGTSSDEPAPTHTYNEPGTYSPTLTVTGPGGHATLTHRDDIRVGYPAPIPNFTANPTRGLAPLSVTFTDASTGKVNACRWQPGDGTSQSGCTLVHTYTAPGVYTVSLEAQGPDAAATKTESDLITVVAPAPIADFTSGPTAGEAPLTVAFSNNSSGEITDYRWDFGDGTLSRAANPAHTYNRAGDYDVSLTVSGPYGTDTLTREGYVQVSGPDFAIETGEITLNHEWQWVDFQHAYDDPIVIVKPLSGAGGDPAVARIEAIESDGFWVRVQEWDYLDRWHTTETAGYIVVERGHHQLADGSWIEADRLEVAGAQGYLANAFAAPFGAVPVVVSAVATTNDASAVTTRMRRIDTSGFEIALQAEEAATRAHGAETVNYLAWEPSTGDLNGLRFEVGRTADAVTHRAHAIEFDETLSPNPAFLADMQSADGPDTANLRWNRTGPLSVDVWVDEEQSREPETGHTTETLGYIAIEQTAMLAALTLEAGEVVVDSAWQRVLLQEDFIDPVVVATAANGVGVDPAVVQIGQVDSSGFRVRLREWDYLDGPHAAEIVSYLVVERGQHQLPDGTRISAGRVQTDSSGTFSKASYPGPFTTTPVVLASVATTGQSETVAHRLDNLTPAGFDVLLQKQENAHHDPIVSETIHYIAWEPFVGEWQGLHFQVGRTADAVTGNRYRIVYDLASTFPPVLLADMQSRDGPDTANLRWDGRTNDSVDVWVAEEQSRDAETAHTTETVGYVIVNDATDVLP